jgi:hypothetical protein
MLKPRLEDSRIVALAIPPEKIEKSFLKLDLAAMILYLEKISHSLKEQQAIVVVS